MPNIDTLSVTFSAKGTKTAVDNIKAMGLAIRGLATNINAIDTSKLGALANAMNNLKRSAPTKAQASRMTDFGKAMSAMAQSFETVNADKVNNIASSMSALKKTAPTKAQAERLGGFNTAVGSFASAINGVDGSKLDTFATGLEVIKKSTPTKSQTERLTAFASAVTELSNAIGAANIGEFSKDMSVLGGAVEQFKKSSVNSITNAVTAMKNMGQTAQQTATAINNATPKKSQDVKMGDNKGTLEQAKEMFAALDKVEIKASGIARIMEKLGLTTPTKKFKDLENQAEKVRQKYEELRATLNKALQSGEIQTDSGEFRKKQAELDALKNSYNELILKQRELAQEGGAMQLSPTLVSSLNTFRDGASKAVSILKNGLVGGFRLASRFAKSFSSHIKQAGSSLKNMVTHGKSASNMAKKFANEIFRVSKMLKLMVTRMALRKVIAEVGNGFKSLAIHSDEFNNSVSGIMNASKRLGYSFSAMIGPLINALAPALIYIINIFTKLANIINQVIAALTGATTWNKAREFTDSWRDSIEDAGEEAEKTRKTLKKTVLGFDELNQLQDNTDTTKKGKDSGGIDDMFDTIKIDKKWKDVADWLKQMWKLGDFYDLGKKIGEKLRDMLESIPWDQIRKTSNKLGRSLATLINGFVEVERLGYDIGKTIAQSVNTVFEFLNGFVHSLHWDSIGKFIADVFNGFFETIDWPLIKDTVVTGMAGIAEAIQNFIETFHWDNISDFIINAVDTITSGIKAFFEGIDWLDLGRKMGEQIRKAVTGIDWKEVGEALGDIIQAAIDWVAGMLDTMPSVEELIQAATDLLDGLFDKVDSEKLGEEVATILNGVYNFLVGFWEENGDKIKEEVKKFFEGFWNKIDKDALQSVIGGVIKVAVLGGIAAVGWKAVKSYFTNKLVASITAKAISKALGGKIAAGVTEAATGEAATGAATTAGASLGTTIAAGLIAAFAGQQVGTEIGKMIFPEDSELYDQYKGISGFFKEIKDIGVGTVDWIKMAWSGEAAEGNFFTSLSKEEQNYYSALKVHYGQDFPEVMQQNIDIMGSYEAAWLKLKEEGKGYYEETQVKLKKMAEEQTNATKAYSENAEKMKGANQEVKDSLKGLDENSLLYKKLAEEMEETTKQAKNVVEESRNVSTAYKGPTEAVEKYKKQTEESSKTTNEWVEKHRQSKQEWDKLKDSLDKTTASTTSNKKALSDLSATTQTTTKDVKEFTDSIIKESAASDENFTKAISDIIKVQNDLSKNTEESVRNSSKTVSEGTKSILADLDTIRSGMTREKWTFQGVADGLGETFRRAKDAIKKEWNQIAETLNGEHEVGGSKVKIDLPKFARGGFPEDGLFMANRHELVGQFSNGKTAVANNAQIVDGISNGVYSAVSRAMAQNGGSNRYIANTIVVDGDVLARTVTKAQDKQNARYSPAY